MAAAILAAAVAVVVRKSAAGSLVDRAVPARQTVQHSFASAWAAAAAAGRRIPSFLALWFGQIHSTAAVQACSAAVQTCSAAVQACPAVPNQHHYLQTVAVVNAAADLETQAPRTQTERSGSLPEH